MERRRIRRQLPMSFWVSLGCLGLSLVNVLFVRFFGRDWLIIRHGIRSYQHLRFGANFAAAFCFGLFILKSGPLVMTWQRRKQREAEVKEEQRKKTKILSDYTEDSTNPDFTKRRLEQLRLEMPELGDLVEKCFIQMDRMDRLQLRLEILLDTNKAEYLQDTVTVLNNVEKRLCRNFRNIINLGIAADGIDRLDTDEVQRYLDYNDSNLNNSLELIQAAAKLINQHNGSSDKAVMNEVRNWIKVILASLAEEEQDEKK